MSVCQLLQLRQDWKFLMKSVNTNTEETAVPESSKLPLGVEIDYHEKEFQIVDGPEWKVSLVEPDKEVENDDGTPVKKLQRATVVLVDLSKLSQNTEGEGEASENLTHFQTEEKLELYEPDKSEQERSNLALEEEEQEEEVQTQEDTEKSHEDEKMEEENTVEEHNKLNKQDMTFEEQKPTEDLATMPAECSIESNTIENKQNEDEWVSGLAQENTIQENVEEEAPVSTQRSLRRRTIRVQSPTRRKSRHIQKQGAEVFEDKTEIVIITEKEADAVDQGVEIVDKENVPQTSTVDATEKVIPLVEAGSEDNVVEKVVEEINKMENKETNLAVTRDTDEEISEVGEEATLEERQNEPLVKNDKDTAETETSMEIDPVVGKEQTYMVGGTTIQIEEKVSEVSLAEAEPDEEREKDEEEKLGQDKPDNSEYQLCNLRSEEEEQLEQLQLQKDTMEDENTVEEQNEPDKQYRTFQEQTPTEDLEEQNDLKVTETLEVYRAIDENVEEAVNSGEHPEKTNTMADETNIIEEAEKYHNITFKEKQTDSDIEMSGLAQEASEAVQEVLEEEASVSTKRILRHRTIQIHSPPRRKSRRLQKQEAEAFEDKTRNLSIRGKVVDEMQETLKKSTVETTEVIPFVEAEPEDDVVEKGAEEINKMENKKKNFAVKKDTVEKTTEVEEEANLEQQQNEPLVKNDNETTDIEKFMEIDPVFGKDKTFVVGGTTIQIEEKVAQVSLAEAEPDEEGEKDDGTPVIQLQRATVVLVDLNKLSQNTEGESDTPEVLTNCQTEEKLEQDKPDNSEYQLCNLTSEEEEQQEQLQKEEDAEKTLEKDKMEDENTVEEQNELNKQDMTFEEQKPTEDLEEQNDLKVTETLEVYRAVDENVGEAVNSGEHPEKTTTMADETNIIEEAEKDHNITFKEQQTDSDIEMSGLAQEASEAVQEVLEEEASVSTKRILRRRTIQINSPPRRKSRRLQKQEAEAFENKTRNLPIRGKVVDEMQETLKKSTVETTEVIPFVEAEPEDDVVKKGAEETNKIENKKTNLAVTKDTVEETPEVEEEANLEQQQNEPLVKNDKESTDTEKSMEIDPVFDKDQTFVVGGTTIQIEEKVVQVSLAEAEPDEEGENDDGTLVIQLQIDPVVSKEQAHVVGGTTIQIEEEFSLGESTETDQSDNERITRRSHRLSAKSVTATQKTRKSTRLHKVELDPVKETNMSRNEHEETSETTEATVNVWMPIITVESNMKSLDEMTNTNVEESTAVAPEASELLMGEEINYKEKASQIVEEDKPTEAEPHEEAVKIQSPPIKKSRQVKRQEAEVFEDKTGTVQQTGKGDEEVHKGVEIDEEETLQKTTVEATENIVSLIEGEPDENVTEQGFEEINNVENKETNLGNEVTPEMERDKVNLEQQNNELSVENEKETAETEIPMGMDEVSVVNKEQTYGLEEATLQAEEEILQIESSETNENKNERSTRRSLRISSQSVTSTQKTRTSARLHKAELEPVKEEKMNINEETSSMTAKTLRVDEALPEISTDVEEDENMTLIKITENEILVEMDKTQKDVEGEVQDVGESQEERKQSRINKTQADEDQEDVMTDEIVEEVIEQHVDLESSTNERFTLALEVEGTSDQGKNKADEENRVVMEAPKEIFTSAEKHEKGEENISDDNEKGLAIGKHVVQSSSTTASTRRKSMRLQMHESKTKEDESNSDSEVDQTAKPRHQRKRKAITDSTSARRLKRHVRARIV